MTDLRSARCVVLAAVSGVWLTACGGAGAPAAPVQPIEPQEDGRILAGSAEIVPEDFLGRTFPLVFERADSGPPEARTQTGVGTVQVIDNDTLLISIGTDVRRFTRTSATSFTDQSGVTAEVTDFGPARYLSVETPFGLSSAFGFETAMSARPTSATYNARSASVVVLAIPGRESVIAVGGEGSVNLTATFADGRISGTLFDNDGLPLELAQVDLLDLGTEQDELRLRTTLEGVITEGGFTGTVSGEATARVNGGPSEPFGLTLRNSDVTGKFFGTRAQAVAGSYSADADFTIPGQTPQSGRLTGFFVSE